MPKRLNAHMRTTVCAYVPKNPNGHTPIRACTQKPERSYAHALIRVYAHRPVWHMYRDLRELVRMRSHDPLSSWYSAYAPTRATIVAVCCQMCEVMPLFACTLLIEATQVTEESR